MRCHNIVLCLVLSTLTIPPVQVEAEPTQWKVEDGGNGHFYEAILVPGPGQPFIAPITWSEANVAAQALGNGWHLATIGSAEENEFVFNLVKDIPEFWFDHGGNSIGPWLGASSPTTGSNDFEWVTDEPFSYTNWAAPSPAANGDGLHFFGLQGGTTPASTWNDYVNTFGTKGYIVETVPEPSSLILFAAAVTGLMTRRRVA